MSSNAEQAPNAGAQAGVGALLMEIGKRAPSPTQAVKVCQILGLATKENIRQVREIAKNKNNTPQTKKKNKKPNKEGRMRAVFLKLIGRNVIIYGANPRYGGTNELGSGKVEKVGREYVQLSGKYLPSGKMIDCFVKYDLIAQVIAQK